MSDQRATLRFSLVLTHAGKQILIICLTPNYTFEKPHQNHDYLRRLSAAGAPRIPWGSYVSPFSSRFAANQFSLFIFSAVL